MKTIHYPHSGIKILLKKLNLMNKKIRKILDKKYIKKLIKNVIIMKQNNKLIKVMKNFFKLPKIDIFCNPKL